jgi:hypothetical protein
VIRVKNCAYVCVCVIQPGKSIESSVYGAIGMSNGLMFILFSVLNGLNR